MNKSTSAAQPSLKRTKDQVSDDELDAPPERQHLVAASDINDQDQRTNTTKRGRHSQASEALGSIPRYVVIHRVCCYGDGSHDKHRKESFFFDTPRLFMGDTKATALRGRQKCRDIEDYLDLHADISFVVHRSYSCNDYCHEYKDTFDCLPIPRIDPDILSQLRPYFSNLRQDGRNAIPQSEGIRIVSKELKRAMKKLESLYPVHLREWYDEKYLCAPYLQLYHCRTILDEYTSAANCPSSGRYQEEIKLLYDYVKGEYDHEWAEAEAMFNNGWVTKRHFPKLFGSNEIVVTLANGQPLAYVCEACITPNILSLQLNCWYWAFDGLFRKEKTLLSVPWPSDSDEISICKLPTYPLKYDTKRLEERLRKRGQEFWDCRHRKFVSYESPNPMFEVRATRPRYMIDTATYQQMHGHNSQLSQSGDLSQAAMDDDDPLEDPFVLLLPANIRGFGFHDKKWRTLSVEHIRKIEWDEGAFEQLVLKPHKKELMKALITVHITASTSNTTDIIQGKGKGLIILLHGGPGTGKTLTAESVAELVQKPLYRVTCGDIGTDPEGVEKYLDSVLYIGTIWGCVVLLDEADVFLEERTQTDLQRNALVSVFLRVLEYYEGILILTSNRVGTFDEGFMSRVQLAMHYPSLDEEGRFEIWNNFLERLKLEVEDVNYDELKHKLNVLARHKLNGRQIRNTVNTARQLSRYKRERLAYSHFHQAIEVSNEFEGYVEKTHGHSNEEWVRAQRIRY